MNRVAGTGSAALASAYLRREVALSIVINSVLSLAFFIGMFGLDPSVPVHIAGAGGYARDFVPQSFMVALMSALVPGAITAARIRGGRIGARIGGMAEPRRALVLRSLAAAILALAAGGVIALVLSTLAANAVFAWTPALAVKIVYGGSLAAIVTPVGLRAALRRAVFC